MLWELRVNIGRGNSMAIVKNTIPIFEFDTEQTAVLNPTHENKYDERNWGNAYEYFFTLCLDAVVKL